MNNSITVNDIHGELMKINGKRVQLEAKKKELEHVITDLEQLKMRREKLETLQKKLFEANIKRDMLNQLEEGSVYRETLQHELAEIESMTRSIEPFVTWFRDPTPNKPCVEVESYEPSEPAMAPVTSA